MSWSTANEHEAHGFSGAVFPGNPLPRKEATPWAKGVNHGGIERDPGFIF